MGGWLRLPNPTLCACCACPPRTRRTPIFNGDWAKGDAAGGVAWLGVIAAHDADTGTARRGDEAGQETDRARDVTRALALADTALGYLVGI